MLLKDTWQHCLVSIVGKRAAPAITSISPMSSEGQLFTSCCRLSCRCCSCTCPGQKSAKLALLCSIFAVQSKKHCCLQIAALMQTPLYLEVFPTEHRTLSSRRTMDYVHASHIQESQHKVFSTKAHAICNGFGVLALATLLYFNFFRASL